MKRKQFRDVIGHPEHGFGLLPNPPDTVFKAFAQHPASRIFRSRLETGSPPQPMRTSNFIYAPPVWNQRRTSSCVGHALACQITTTFAALGRPLPSPATPRTIYTLSRAVCRSDVNTPLTDSGASPAAGVAALGRWGVVLEAEDDGGRTANSSDYADFLEAHVNDEMRLDEIETGKDRLVVGFSIIADNDPHKEEQFQASLDTGHTISTAVDGGSSIFQDYRGQKPLDYCGDEPDHFICVLDYMILDDGTVLYLVQNSWGTELWTPDGRAWVTSDFIRLGCFGSLVANLENTP